MVHSNKENRPTKIRDKEVSIAALCDAGEALFAKHGFAGTTLDMLVKESGVNRAMVSYYFGSKTGLYDAVIEKLVQDAVDHVSDRVDAAGNIEARFRNYVHALCDAFCSRPTLPAILLREYMGGKNQERAGPFAQIFQFFRRTETLYTEGRNAGQFRAVDAHQLHLSLVGPLIFFAVTQQFRANTFAKFAADITNPAAAAFAEHHATMLWKGLTDN